MRYTQDQVRLKIEELAGKMPGEIHYSNGLRRYSKEIMNTVYQKTLEDDSIVKKDYLWARHPVASSISVFKPEIEHNISPSADFPNILRARTLVALLMPLLSYQDGKALDVSVILDADCWKKGLGLCSAKLVEICKASNIAISFSCEASNRVPGLQIADLFAGVTRDYYGSSTSIEPYEISTKHRVTQVGQKALTK